MLDSSKHGSRIITCIRDLAECADGSACVYSNDWYSQCLPGATASPTTTHPNPTTSPTTTRPTTTIPTSTSPAATGFVKTSGTRFTLNGQKYTVAGYATDV